MSSLKAIRGTRDLLPDQTPLWNRVESTARAVFARYGFGEVRTPIIESTELFARGVGEETDIVSKEMFTWEDGERFAETKLIAAYEQSGPGIEIQTNQRGLRHYWNPDTSELVGFRPKADIQALQWMRDMFSGYLGHATPPSPILVVPYDQRNLAKDPNGLIQIEQLPGSFFESTQSLTLRPENTAGVVRAYIEHKLGETGNLQKLFYIGPQFRRERPQKGRYRQFWQIGAEVIGPPSSGSESPIRDAEILEMLASLLDELGVRDWKLELNSVGHTEDRVRYNAALREALQPVKHLLCPDNQRRADINPLRVLDSKDENDQALINGLPKIADFLSPESAAHFQQVLAALEASGVPYTLNPRLVRGLDYYTRTTFEFTVTTGLGTQNALLGGGRYDGLSEMLGGPKAPGIGFAIGEDRLILTLQAQIEADQQATGATGPDSRTRVLDAYIAPLGLEQNPAALALAKDLRKQGLLIEVGDGTFKLRKSFDTADKLARHIVLLGEDEAATQIYTVKTFSTGQQTKVPVTELTTTLRA